MKNNLTIQRDPTTAEECFAMLGGFLGHIRRSMVTAPISPEERTKLATLVTATFFTTTVDFAVAPKPNSTVGDREAVIDELIPIIKRTARDASTLKLDS